MAEAANSSNLSACPVCGARMELLSRQQRFVTAGCTPCHFSITVPLAAWQAARAELDATASSPPPSA